MGKIIQPYQPKERVKSIKIQSNILATTPNNENHRFGKRAEV
jgi:hypothetical protein